MGVADKVYHTRYFTYWLEFPDGETWVDQTPFIHSLQFELQNMVAMNKNMKMEWMVRANEIANKGESRWTDNNGVKHCIKIEDTKRNRVWGSKH